MKVYMKKKRIGVDAIGTYNIKTKECVVLKGSIISPSISSAPTFRGARKIAQKRSTFTDNNVVTENVKFKSCSTAGNFVTGTSTDGFRSWKVEDGRTLREYLADKTS